MGYIPPTTNYQYTQYAEREVKNNYDPFQIFPVGRTRAAANTSEEKRLERGQSFRKRLNKNSSSVQELAKESMVEEIYSDLTGKGRYFNEVV
ncbi:hypothetical protein ABE096_15865 [Robertmurraya massiliosenegalensis]|uniref:hypothetical protein n=1 Tax=Robertmurraya TaxID=2837507 RepID=UPI0039A639E3